MAEIKERIQRVTSKGQITLPASWRKKFATDTISVKTEGNSIKITPVKVVDYDEDEEGYITLFDAVRDNGGKGVSVDEFIKVLDKINNE